jgi:hypothetical protein
LYWSTSWLDSGLSVIVERAEPYAVMLLLSVAWTSLLLDMIATSTILKSGQAPQEKSNWGILWGQTAKEKAQAMKLVL